MYAFDYRRAASAADAVAAARADPDARFLAGGMTLIPTLKQRLAAPSALIDLGGLAELTGVRAEEQGLVIGAMTTHAEVAAAPAVRRFIPALAALAGGIGDAQVRHRGTLGGSLANNDPIADYPAAVLGLDATVRTDRRTIAADAFFRGMFETALEEDELIVAVRFPRPVRAGWCKVPNPASRYAMAGVFVAATGAGVRVAVTGAAMTGVFRATDMEAALARDFRPEALDPIRVPPDDMNDDIHGSAEYRAHLVKVMAKRAVAAAR